MNTSEFFIAMNVSPGKMVRLERIHRGWRQVDLAEIAGVTQAEVSAFERGLSVIPVVRRRILESLGFDLKGDDRAKTDQQAG